MGSGKTTLGKKLAKELDFTFIDTDKAIAKQHGAINRIFETKGEEFFRALETKALEDALMDNAIVATGGGAILREANRSLLKAHHVVFLDTSAEHVLGKINLAKRPLLKDNPERWQQIYDERIAIYRQVADQTVFSGGKGIRSLLDEIKEGLPK
jgi:shikimate kinase